MSDDFGVRRPDAAFLAAGGGSGDALRARDKAASGRRTPNRIRIGTRGSRLALAQVEIVRGLFPNVEIEPVIIRTSGDKGDRDRRGAFVREIQVALLEDQVDIALHCLKDLPTDPVPGLSLTAYLEREDPRDAFISRGSELADLPHGATVGTGSVRRTSQLAAIRPDLQFRRLVGNVDTRLRKLIEGEYDAIVLAVAGLSRLGVLENWSESEYRELTVRPLPPEIMLPAPGQAVLVLETREDDPATIALVHPLNHKATEICAQAERIFLSAFGGGCSVPVAAWGTPEGETIALSGLVASPDGTTVLRASGSSPMTKANALALQLAERLKANGAMSLFTAREETE